MSKLLQFPVDTVVRALRDLDPEGANVKAGDVGEVFEAADDPYGPLVEWASGCVCNVYEGEVEVVAR